VRRKHEFEDTFDKLYKKSLKSRIKVVFINEYGMVESGIDAGGLTKELLTRVFK
jgi:ubiquitin-protein ligase E3 C